MKYGWVKVFTLLVLMVVYILFTFTLAVAYVNGGYVVLTTNKYNEGLAEVVVLSLLSPVFMYVVCREVKDTLKW
ncbi:MAG: hypothetical protein ACTSXC_07335 [Candidatus Freyarchaeota archaeon]